MVAPVKSNGVDPKSSLKRRVAPSVTVKVPLEVPPAL
jgi:hypothetical protein